MASMALPIIAIVGRPNVGKSTLFNRLIGVKHAITSPVPGTTRDRIYYETTIGDYATILVDTGGIEFEKKQDIELDVQSQARLAVQEANLIYFVVDTTAPLTANDFELIQYLRKASKPMVLIAHKTDNRNEKTTYQEMIKFGFGEPVYVSSIHDIGISELVEATEVALKKLKIKKEKSRRGKEIRLAIIGKPNVGKSSLVNALFGEDKLIVSDKPGTTIDATDTMVTFEGSKFLLIDTAGIRRRGKQNGLEKFGVLRALAAVSRCDIACLVLDSSEPLSNQDLHVSQYVLDSGKGVVILVNKTDLMTKKQEQQNEYLGMMHYRMSYMPWSPVLFISAKQRKNIFKIFELAKNITAERKKKIDDEVFNSFIKAAVLTHQPVQGGKLLTISRGKQIDTNPPVFAFETSDPDKIHFSYKRFLENEIRRKFGFFGTSIKMEFYQKLK